MKTIWLDFKHPVAPGLRALRVALLLVGVLALGYSLLQQRQVGSEVDALAWQKQSLTRLETRTLPRLQATSESAASQDAAKRANEVLRQLNLPWDRLFAALEQSVSPEVSVLAIAPDATKSALTLKASATDMDAVVDFMERLQKTRLLSNIHLATQEIAEDDSRHPLQFTLRANWEAKP